MFKFISDDTLKVSADIIVKYDLKEDNGTFILNHNNLLGSESLIVEVIPNKNRLELTLTERFSGKFKGTWIEEQNYP